MREVDLIIERARAANVDPRVCGVHLLSRVTVLTYVRIADEIKKRINAGRILDWGCGYGQMSFLLQRRGLEVESYDLGKASDAQSSPVFAQVKVQYGVDPVRLPYPDAKFDAVLSCGVLEHVPDETGSLAEIYRVMRPGGLFFIYNLPQRGSYKEFLISRLHLGYAHERKYTLAEARTLLGRAHLRPIHATRSGMLPQNLTPVPQLRGLYNRCAQPIISLDRGLAAVPWLNQTAEALELVAVKQVA